MLFFNCLLAVSYSSWLLFGDITEAAMALAFSHSSVCLSGSFAGVNQKTSREGCKTVEDNGKYLVLTPALD